MSADPVPPAFHQGVLAALGEHAIVSVTDASATILWVNRRFCDISGYRADELIGANHRLLKSGHHEPAFYQQMWQELAAGRSWNGEICNRRKSGELYWVAATIVPELDATGMVCRYVSVRTDITAARQAQQQALAAEERYRRAQRFANLGSWDLDLRTNALYWSERIAPLFGYPEGQLATSYENFLAAVHPDDRAGLVAAVNNSIAQGTAYEYEHRCVWPDGSVHWLLERGDVTRDADGQPLRMLGVVQDITPRKEAQAQLAMYRHVVESIDEGIALCDATTLKLTYLNPAARKILGWSAQDGIGRTPISLVPADARPAVIQALQDIQRGGTSHFDAWFVRPDGTRVPLRNTITTVRGDNGEPTHLVNAFGDRSEELARQEILQRALDDATRANQAKNEFMSRMSHELRTPLNAILGFSQLLLLRGVLEAPQADSVREILKSGQHLLELINDVLDIARIDLGAFKVGKVAVPLAQVADESLAIVAGQAHERSIRLRNEVPPGLRVWADALRLKQCVVNLLSNAIKYNRPAGHVDVRAVVQAGDRIRLEVADSGVGMSELESSLLFQPFTRLERHRELADGVGIGLSITRRLVELMGGRVGVDSREGEGSVFWIDLDSAETTGAAAVADTATVADAADASAAGEPRRVLYVEDNDVNLKLVRAMLGLLPGVTVLGATTAAQGMAKARSERPDLILLDIGLPDIDGLSLLAMLRRLPGLATVPAIAVSASAMPADVQAGRDAGFDDYLTKPIDMHLLLQRVQALLRPAG